MTEPSAAELFKTNWATYQHVVEADLMHHKMLCNLTFRALADFKTPFSILDLGCGDARLLTETLRNLSVSHYTGYDLSGHALELAKVNISSAGWPSALREGRMECLLNEEAGTFDLVHSSFAIHHLPDPEKAKLFQSIAGHLNENGMFIYIDVCRQPEESVEVYAKGYVRWIYECWDVITTAEKDSIREHIMSYDIPSTLDDTREMAAEAGMHLQQLIPADHRHYFMQFTRNRKPTE